jgi:hypothetical protein
MNHQEFVQIKRNEVVSIAREMLRGSMNLLEGTRRICSLRNATEEPDSEVFAPFRAIESETDHFAVGEVRLRYSKEQLEQLDRELKSYLTDTKNEIVAACEKLIRYFSNSKED